MPYKGVVKDKVIVLEGKTQLPEGTKVEVIPESEKQASQVSKKREEIMARLWATTEAIFKESGMTSDSVEIIRELREERSNR